MSNLLVVLDSGHYGDFYNKGIINNYYESRQMYELTLIERNLFLKSKVDCILTHERDVNPSLFLRGSVAINNSKKYDNICFISNHSNACSDSNVNGVEAYRSIQLPTSEKLGKELTDGISKIMKNKNRGVKTKTLNDGLDYFGVIRAATTNIKDNNSINNVFIIEHGFHTNNNDCRFLLDKNNLNEIAKFKVETILNHYNQNIIYRVRLSKDDAKSQIGAFRNLNNAIAIAKANGCHVFTTSGIQVF